MSSARRSPVRRSGGCLVPRVWPGVKSESRWPAAPYKPRTKGKAEVREEVKSLGDLNTRLEGWLEWYNYSRPHASLAEGAPGRCYRPSPRAAPAELGCL